MLFKVEYSFTGSSQNYSKIIIGIFRSGSTKFDMEALMTLVFRWSVVASALVLTACGPSMSASKSGHEAKTLVNGNMVQNGPADIDAKTMLAAVEPFEALAETAFTATPTELDKAVVAAQAAVLSIKNLVPADVVSRLQASMVMITAARKADARADIAIASIEGFREVVSASRKTSDIPADVSLLDYAGIRYDSDVQAQPTRWDDMTKAILYGRERVAALSSRAPAAKLLPRMNAAFAGMEKAVTLRDVKGARTAAKAELDLVDELELAFAPPAKTR